MLILIMIWLACVRDCGLRHPGRRATRSSRPLPTLIAGVGAFAAALPATRTLSRWTARIFPRDESSAVSQADLVGLTGPVTLGPLDQGKPGRVRVKDRHGNIHVLRAIAAAEPRHPAGRDRPAGRRLRRTVSRHPRAERSRRDTDLEPGGKRSWNSPQFSRSPERRLALHRRHRRGHGHALHALDPRQGLCPHRPRRQEGRARRRLGRSCRSSTPIAWVQLIDPAPRGPAQRGRSADHRGPHARRYHGRVLCPGEARRGEHRARRPDARRPHQRRRPAARRWSRRSSSTPCARSPRR